MSQQHAQRGAWGVGRCKEGSQRRRATSIASLVGLSSVGKVRQYVCRNTSGSGKISQVLLKGKTLHTEHDCRAL
eukprot:scaffold13928_cov29-Tisochrysis_lutea.AAC.6